jgi:hypothetical protein
VFAGLPFLPDYRGHRGYAVLPSRRTYAFAVGLSWDVPGVVVATGAEETADLLAHGRRRRDSCRRRTSSRRRRGSLAALHASVTSACSPPDKTPVSHLTAVAQGDDVDDLAEDDAVDVWLASDAVDELAGEDVRSTKVLAKLTARRLTTSLPCLLAIGVCARRRPVCGRVAASLRVYATS